MPLLELDLRALLSDDESWLELLLELLPELKLWLGELKLWLDELEGLAELE